MSDDKIKYMVDRFLAWRLPENFNPDGGISFKKMRNENTSFRAKNEPVGTNLFDAEQAEEMVRYLVDGIDTVNQQKPDPMQVTERDKVAAEIITNCCSIIDVVKGEWAESWSKWDQSVRDAASEWLKGFYDSQGKRELRGTFFDGEIPDAAAHHQSQPVDWSKIETRQWRDETGKEIKGALWVRRDDVVRQLLRAGSQPVRVEERPFIKGDKVLIEGIFERMFDADYAVVMGGDGKNGIVCDLAEVHHESAQPQQPLGFREGLEVAAHHFPYWNAKAKYPENCITCGLVRGAHACGKEFNCVRDWCEHIRALTPTEQPPKLDRDHQGGS